MWKRAHVETLQTGQDEAVRTVILRTPSGERIARPVQLVVPLEIDQVLQLLLASYPAVSETSTAPLVAKQKLEYLNSTVRSCSVAFSISQKFSESVSLRKKKRSSTPQSLVTDYFVTDDGDAMLKSSDSEQHDKVLLRANLHNILDNAISEMKRRFEENSVFCEAVSACDPKSPDFMNFTMLQELADLYRCSNYLPLQITFYEVMKDEWNGEKFSPTSRFEPGFSALCADALSTKPHWIPIPISARILSVQVPPLGFPLVAYPHALHHRYVPHVLKLIRNWFLDTGFVLPGNVSINKGPLEASIDSEDPEIKICHKITKAHLTVEGPNARIPRSLGDPSSKPYGKDLEKQNHILNEMLDTMKDMRCYDDSEFISCRVISVIGAPINEETKLSSTSTDMVRLEGFEEGPDDTDFKSTVNDMGMHALEYLAGWVAKKLKDDFPYLIENKKDERSKINTMPETAGFSWTKHLLYGRLCIPSSEWFTQAVKLNEGFQNHHRKNTVKGADLKQTIEQRDRKIGELERKVDDLEQYQRRQCVRIEEEIGENTNKLVVELATNIGVELKVEDIDRCHRVGRMTSDGRLRPIIVKFCSYRKRSEVFFDKRRLKGSGMTLREDLTKLAKLICRLDTPSTPDNSKDLHLHPSPSTTDQHENLFRYPQASNTLAAAFAKYSSSLQIAHINAQSLTAHYNEIYSIFSDLNLHSLALSESWLNPTLPTNLIHIDVYHVPLKSKRVKKRPASWLSLDICAMVKERDAAHRQYRLHKTDTSYDYYKHLRNKTTQAIRNAKLRYFHDILHQGADSSKLWRDLRTIGLGNSRRQSDNITIPLETLNDHFITSQSLTLDQTEKQ
ncbi:hypothetical protein ANN_19329 [Periplaneta americana]|uniref:Transposable element P transposase-like C-terminal domain-containing protein n=1 Tax=Periplaneta americana TaxID=6978 RepID=A0ABQ8S9J8_PERAM|nr:hypothetical protein ANN_19329 [Periplaneta americana]